MRQRSCALMVAVVLAAGCATTPPPYTGIGPYPQLERGRPFPPVDVIGNVLSLPGKLLLWSWKFNNHAISADTEAFLIDYLEARDLPAMDEAKFRLNQYRPFHDVGRLMHNRHVAWPYRLLLGLPITLVFDVLLPGRLFPWGDYYNPYTNTVHLYSDHTAIALHEAGHVHDFARQRYKGTYAAMRLIPLVDLYQEAQATGETLDYLRTNDHLAQELAAYKILYPAFGTYVGNYIFPPIGTIGGALLGHIAGRAKARAVLRQASRSKPSATSATPLVEQFLEAEARQPSLMPAKAAEPGDPFDR